MDHKEDQKRGQWLKGTKKTALKKCGFFTIHYNRSLFCFCVHADLFLILAHSLKTDHAVDQCKQSIILAAAHVDAGMDLGASLSDEDIACENKLTARALGTKPLRRAVSTVSRTTYALLVSEKLQFDKHITLPPLQCIPNSLFEYPTH